jgi:hypothetical protein
MPREHGAYAELLFPLVTGLALGRPGVPGAGFAAAAVLFFLLHEPLAVLAGARGERVRTDSAARARRRILILAAAGALAGGVALATGSRDAALAALIPLGFAAALAPAALTARVKNLGGELLVAATLAGTLVPVAVAGGAGWHYALLAAAIWFTSFLLATLTVHALKTRAKGHLSPRWTLRAAPLLGIATIVAGVAAGVSGAIPLLAGLAVLPPALVTLAVNLLAVHPRRLRRVGWSLVGANLATLGLLLAA